MWCSLLTITIAVFVLSLLFLVMELKLPFLHAELNLPSIERGLGVGGGGVGAWLGRIRYNFIGVRGRVIYT